MKRKLTTIAMIIVCFLLEGTVFQKLKIGNIAPNLLVILTASLGFMRGQREGMYVGLIAGFFADFFWGGTLGIHMILLLVIGYADGSFKRLFYDDDMFFPLVLITASDFLYGAAIYAAMYMMQGDFSFGAYLFDIILPELVYTVLIALALYPLILRINQKLEAEEQRSASKFV